MTMGEWREEDPGNVSPENLEVSLAESMRCLSIKNNEGGQNQNAEISHYPDRPDEPNCSYFMRTGQCGYGSRCRFNHPAILGKEVQCGGKLQEKAGQPNCQFFLKTGTCKYGPSCKYHHPHDKLMPLLNKLGLPMRQDEKPCPYYVRNGSCKFGFACKFHHPEPVSGTIIREENQLSQGVLPLMGGTPSWMPVQQSLYLTAQGSQGFSSFIPVMFSPTHNLTTGQQAWGVYAGGTNFQEFYRPEHLQEDSNSSVPAVLPERPDQPECQYFLKTGRCKYGPACKYHHPRERIDSFSIGPHMLPLRPGQAVCTFYASYGSCKYGSACKFDHPYVWTGYSPGYPAYPSLSSWDASSSSSSLFPFEGIPPMDMTSLSISAADDPPAISPALDHSD